MSFVLSVVCLEPAGPLAGDFSPLFTEESIQDGNHACYLEGLSRYFDRPIQGECVHVFVDSGERYPRSDEPIFTSSVFFLWPEDDPEDIKPIILTIGPEYRAAFHALLSHLLGVSGIGRLVIVCEWNGDVTQVESRERALENLASGEIQLHGPFSREEFWRAHDAGLIHYFSLTIVEERLKK